MDVLNNEFETIDLGINNEYIDTCEYVNYSEVVSTPPAKDILTILQLNIRGALGKQDHLKSLL